VESHDRDLRIITTRDGTNTRLAVGGEIDMATADDLAERLLAIADGGEGHVEIDMSKVTFCDSTGLKVLLDAHRTLADAGRALRLTRASPQVMRLLVLSGTEVLLADPGDVVPE
jgi:anti-sigma B factor antagonist